MQIYDHQLKYMKKAANNLKLIKLSIKKGGTLKDGAKILYPVIFRGEKGQ